MIKFTEINKTETYVELTTDKGEKMLMPTNSTIFVDDNSGAISVKNIATRKTVGLVIDGQPVPPKPQYRWVDDGFTCKGYDKWQQMKQQESTDSGATWHDTGVVSATSLIEADSEDCGYVPRNYLRFKALEDCVFNFNKQDGEVLYYSLDKGNTWTELTEPTPVIHDGEYIYWKGAMNDVTQDIETRFPSSGRFNVEGNIMSLLYGDDFEGKTSLEGRFYTFFRLFGNTSVVDASSLVLPATTLGVDCYTGMFKNCTSLTVAPELPATTLENRCYVGMFEGCTSLTTAPELPATTLVGDCYISMFEGCTSLTTAPELLATRLTRNFFGCYWYMFKNCSNLNYVKCLATENSDGSSFISGDESYDWVSGVASSGTFVKAAGASWSTGNSGVPRNWNVEDVQ